jgi:hypothetical protein
MSGGGREYARRLWESEEGSCAYHVSFGKSRYASYDEEQNCGIFISEIRGRIMQEGVVGILVVGFPLLVI